MAEAAAVYPPLEARPVKNTIVLFDVDGTLTPARRVCSPVKVVPLPVSAPDAHISVVWSDLINDLLVAQRTTREKEEAEEAERMKACLDEH